MFGIHYIKVPPTQYVIHFVNGRKRRAGAGLAFFYFKPSASLVVVPVGSADVPFIFNEISQDFQPLTVQGELTYRVQDPEMVASLLNYTVDGAPFRYLSDDPEKLSQRLINLLQVEVRAEVQRLPLRAAIHASESIASQVMEKLRNNAPLAALGVQISSVAIQGIRAVPEVARALEAAAREEFMRRADEAIYDRRNASVEQERRIKENELNTEIVVEDKKRQIRETKVAADLAIESKEQGVRTLRLNGQIELEKNRKQLTDARTENARLEADNQAYAVEASLKPLQGLDPEVLQLLAVQSAEPRLMVSMALRELARNAGKIGNLNLSPELLQMLMDHDPRPAQGGSKPRGESKPQAEA